MAQQVDDCHETVTIAMVGKYTGLSDSYLSVSKGLQHAAFENRQLVIEWIEASNLEDSMIHGKLVGNVLTGFWFQVVLVIEGLKEGKLLAANTPGKTKCRI